MTLPTREKARRWRDADTDNKIYMAYCDGVLQTREEWAATIDYEAAVQFALSEVKKGLVYTETEYDAAMRGQVLGIVDAALGKGEQ